MPYGPHNAHNRLPLSLVSMKSHGPPMLNKKSPGDKT